MHLHRTAISATARRTTGQMLAVVTIAAVMGGCASRFERYPLAAPLWDDPDRNHVAEKPKSYFSPFAWDAVDQTMFRPVSRVLAVDVPGPSVNVNAFDEVPDSSWFTNRIGLGRGWTVEDSRRGSCPDQLLSPEGPWTVTAAKPDGANPGFIIRGDDGNGYLLKMDGGATKGERATTADVFGSRMYQAVGFHAPCNTIVYFDPAILEIDPEATTADSRGKEFPMTQEDVDKVLSKALVAEDGRLRASASLFLSGRPIGPWTYQSTRSDDPNDVVPHEDRRDLRGARVLAAWLNHFDAREQNTLAMWIEEDGRTFVRHHYIDFGDCFGSRWDIDPLSRRFGHSHYLHVGHITSDFLTLGAILRPWETVDVSEVAPMFGYYDAQHFVPEKWKPGYPNPAFVSMRDEDGAWMARILAHVTDEHIDVMLSEAQMIDGTAEMELRRTLVARRDKILAHYLPLRSPLTHFEVRDGSDAEEVCFTDLALETGVTDASVMRYESRMYFGNFREPRWVRQEGAAGPSTASEICVSLTEDGARPATRHERAAANSIARYAILDLVIHAEPGADPVPPARLHFYDLGSDGFQLVGVERPADDAPPK